MWKLISLDTKVFPHGVNTGGINSAILSLYVQYILMIFFIIFIYCFFEFSVQKSDSLFFSMYKCSFLGTRFKIKKTYFIFYLFIYLFFFFFTFILHVIHLHFILSDLQHLQNLNLVFV